MDSTWLAHSELFTQHWTLETKSWVRDLGWFTQFEHEAKDSLGWAQYGDHELSVLDYVNIVDAVDSDKKLYRYHEGVWAHIEGPVLFIVKKSVSESYIAGWAGPKKLIDALKKKTDNPWDWEGINLIDVVPTSATYIFQKYTHKRLPVIFASNGETNAEESWKHLLKMCPRAIRIENIDGRRNMFLRAAEIADDASHFFLVTGKNFVTDKTVFDYIPDHTVPNAHIMFQAKNMSNRLEYGHMAVGCYNTTIVKNTPKSFGLDFTEYGKIYHVPRTVSDARFATSEYEAWRTAFRECVKLSLKDSDQAKTWLRRWASFAEGEFSEWVLLGAEQGIQFAQENINNPEELQHTENWTWLRYYFEKFSKDLL